MADVMMRLVQGFCERLERKPFLKRLTRDWDSQIFIQVADERQGFSLIFTKGNVRLVTENDIASAFTLQVTGKEEDLQQLFCGNEWELLKAQARVAMSGPVRDQLKWDALLRLTCASQ